MPVLRPEGRRLDPSRDPLTTPDNKKTEVHCANNIERPHGNGFKGCKPNAYAIPGYFRTSCVPNLITVIK